MLLLMEEILYIPVPVDKLLPSSSAYPLVFPRFDRSQVMKFAGISVINISYISYDSSDTSQKYAIG